MRRIIYYILSIVVLVCSCKREAIYPYRFAGKWNIDKLTLRNYTTDGRLVDSEKSISDPGTMYLFNNTDNEFELEYQAAKFEFKGDTAVPPAIRDLCSRSDVPDPANFNCNYVGGPHGTERLTFWIPKEGELHEYELYTVSEFKRNSMTLTLVRLRTDGTMLSSEIWKCSIIK